MDFKDFHKKNIPGLTFYGDVTEKGLLNLMRSFSDPDIVEKEFRCCKLEQVAWPVIEKNYLEDGAKKVIFAKVPAVVNTMNFKGPIYREILKNRTPNKFYSIRWYVNVNREFYIQVIFE